MVNLNIEKHRLDVLCRRNGVRELSVFGSVARGDSRPESDVDILVDFKENASVGFLALARLMRELSELIGRKVDLVVKNGLHPRIKDQVLAEAEVLFAA